MKTTDLTQPCQPATEGRGPFTGELRHRRGKTFIKSFGESKVGEEPATEDTLYYIASLTKSFTATTLLSVLEEQAGSRKAITLKSKIHDILPDDFVLKDEYATSHATLEDALTHVLGVGQHEFNYGGDGYSVKDAVRSMRHLSTTAELREKHQYLNMGYMVIQHVIETLTGEPIEQCHQKYIWEPLGMNSTYIRLKDAEASQKILADGYSWDPVARHLDHAEHVNDYPLVGGGGIITSIKDLTTYINAVIHRKLPLGPAWQEELFRPRVVTGPGPYKYSSTNMYCLGWGTYHYRGQRIVTHSGGITGFNSRLLLLPDKGWGVAFLSNNHPNGIRAIEVALHRLLDDYLGVPFGEREDQMSKQIDKFEHSLDDLLNTRERLYPALPVPRLALTLPLEKYAGTYYNAGYRSITFEVAKPLKDTPVADGVVNVLHTSMLRLNDITLDLEHVSGEFFIAWADTKSPRITSRTGLRAQFCIGSRGDVERFGMSFDPMTIDSDDPMMVWFERQA